MRYLPLCALYKGLSQSLSNCLTIALKKLASPLKKLASPLKSGFCRTLYRRLFFLVFKTIILREYIRNLIFLVPVSGSFDLTEIRPKLFFKKYAAVLKAK